MSTEEHATEEYIDRRLFEKNNITLRLNLT